MRLRVGILGIVAELSDWTTVRFPAHGGYFDISLYSIYPGILVIPIVAVFYEFDV